LLSTILLAFSLLGLPAGLPTGLPGLPGLPGTARRTSRTAAGAAGLLLASDDVAAPSLIINNYLNNNYNM
jgi:hypothetical protein